MLENLRNGGRCVRNKVYSGIDNLPNGISSEEIVQGCLVLEGGAFRGVYEEGVLDAMLEAGINMQCTIGVSAGALNGMNYVAGQIGRSARVNLRYRHDHRYVGVRALRNNHGIIGFDFLFEGLKNIDSLNYERFHRKEQRFIAVATNCKTGKTEYFEKGLCKDIFQAIRASATLPYISKMVDIDGTPYLDGGCSCRIAYQWALNENFEKIVVVKTRDDSFRKPIKDKKIHRAKAFYHFYPELAESLARSDEDYNRQCDEIEKLRREKRIFVISPSKPVNVGRIEGDMEKLGKLYYLGYEDAKKQMKDLMDYLSINR